MDFYFDENLPPRVANALNALEEGEEDNVYHTQVAFGKGILDPDLYPMLKKANGILITIDLKMLSRKNEYELIKTLGITVIFLCIPRNENFAFKYKAIIDRWEEIKKTCRENKQPFLCKIKMKGQPEILS
jgi:hypothetical protein